VEDSPQALLDSLPKPSFEKLWTSDLWVVAVTLAAIASIETLLSIEAVDKIDPWRRTSGASRELLAQGVGNVACGLAGGLPMTSVIVRSSANVYSGGRTRISAVVHSGLLLALVVAVPYLLNRIPLGALAAVLILVGYRLARVALFRHMYRQGAEQFIPFALTIVVTVFSDLLLGVAIGMVTGVLMVLIGHYASAIAVERDGDDWLVLFTKDVNFLNKTRLRRVLAEIPDGAGVVIDGCRAQFIDHDIQAMINNFVVSAKHRDLDVIVRGLESKRHPIKLPGAP
jgi:MFS superfamily sulfate permease-like transporter